MTVYVSQRKINEGTYPSLAVLVNEISAQVAQHGTLAKFPAEAVGNTRNDMYLASEAIRFLMKDKENDLTKDEATTLNAYKKSLDNATKFIPLWVKVAVAIALGLGTMIGWKRIVVTVGEKIGKTHLTYAQGASAELVAAGTIGAADVLGLPVSTTHVLSSGRRRHDGGQRLRTADGDDPQPADGLGADAALRHHALGVPVLVLQPDPVARAGHERVSAIARGQPGPAGRSADPRLGLGVPLSR